MVNISFLMHVLPKDINALREDLMELKPTFFVGVPRVFERVHEGICILYELINIQISPM